MTKKDLCRIGSRLKAAREAKHLTREQLAEMVDLTDNYIGMLERGERMPKLATFMDIIEALEVTAMVTKSSWENRQRRLTSYQRKTGKS